MSRLVSDWEYGGSDYDLGDMVYFDSYGSRLYGEVVRVYNTREYYHVEVRGQRYEVNRTTDNMSRTE